MKSKYFKNAQMVSVGHGDSMKVGYGNWDRYMDASFLWIIHKGFVDKIIVKIDSSVVYINTIEQRDDCLEKLNKIIKDKEELIGNYNEYLAQIDMMKDLLKNSHTKESSIESTSYIDKSYAMVKFNSGPFYNRLMFGQLSEYKKTITIFQKPFTFNRYTALTKDTPEKIEIDLLREYEKTPVITSTDKKKVREKLEEKYGKTKEYIEEAKDFISWKESMKDMLLTKFTEKVSDES